MIRDFFLGFIRIHVLHHAAKEPVYGLFLIEELRHHGYEVGPGTLYPVLHSLTDAGYLARRDRVVGGRVRKYYTTTRAGHKALTMARKQIRELVQEVLHERRPAAAGIRRPGRARSRRG
jgi:DNA-binding PadR family transcriptional regulator